SAELRPGSAGVHRQIHGRTRAVDQGSTREGTLCNLSDQSACPHSSHAHPFPFFLLVLFGATRGFCGSATTGCGGGWEVVADQKTSRSCLAVFDASSSSRVEQTAALRVIALNSSTRSGVRLFSAAALTLSHITYSSAPVRRA